MQQLQQSLQMLILSVDLIENFNSCLAFFNMTSAWPAISTKHHHSKSGRKGGSQDNNECRRRSILKKIIHICMFYQVKMLVVLQNEPTRIISIYGEKNKSKAFLTFESQSVASIRAFTREREKEKNICNPDTGLIKCFKQKIQPFLSWTAVDKYFDFNVHIRSQNRQWSGSLLCNIFSFLLNMPWDTCVAIWKPNLLSQNFRLE